ncbi:MAG: 3-phosphoshikimate 1-carboxyvinyltransferase, partial [Faecalibacterium sp.]|nr:3-phosphoshikimate 1-carboxyvinyltransferase [Faecalibacterium sp.]
MRVHIHPGAAAGTLAAPPSKSMAHRAVICAALAHGTSRIYNLEYSQDITATIGAMRQLCARITAEEDHLRVEGLGGFATVTRPVDCGESGSTLRFLWPLFSLTNQKVTLTGRGKLMQRPLTVYDEIAAAQKIRTQRFDDRITLFGQIRPGKYTVAGNVSSQFISGLALALPLLEKGSMIQITPPFESRSYVQLTLQAMQAFGVQAFWQGQDTLIIPGQQKYTPADYTVEGDYSQAAFWAVLGAAKGGITLTGLAETTLQGDAAILPILKACGANIARTGDRVTFEPARMTGTTIDLA